MQTGGNDPSGAFTRDWLQAYAANHGLPVAGRALTQSIQAGSTPAR